MTLNQLKKIVKITDILGISDIPDKNEFFILSPFRNEKTPSFKINILKNIWYDFGTGEGGSVLDLIIKLKNCNTKEAVSILKNLANDTNSFSFSPAKISFNQNETKKTDIAVKKIVDKVENKALIDYALNRKINYDLIKKYFKEIYFKKSGKNYFGLAIKNDSGGYEYRNRYMKGCINKKDIVTYKASYKNMKNEVNIFEGIFDFLSFLTYYEKMGNVYVDVIVLNSLSLINKINLSKYNRINLFLDNDKAGQEAKSELCEKYTNKYIKDYSYIYKNYKDFNEFLQNN